MKQTAFSQDTNQDIITAFNTLPTTAQLLYRATEAGKETGESPPF